MDTRDQRIGAAVLALRGGHSQQWLADAMRDQGHRWSQATVWSVEKGERPLRLTEAADLVRALGGTLDDLVWSGPDDAASLDWAENVAPVFQARDIARRREQSVAAEHAEWKTHRMEAESAASDALAQWARRNPGAAKTMLSGIADAKQLTDDEAAQLRERRDAQLTDAPSGMRGGKFELYKDKAGKYRFRLKDGEGRVVAKGGPFATKDAAQNAISSQEMVDHG